MTTLREMRAIMNWHLGSARWLFIHIPKNAGVSIRKAPELSSRIVSADPYFYRSRAQVRAVRDLMQARGEHHGLQHARWRDLHPKVTERLACVAIVRNPWARTVSRWQFARLVAEQGKMDPADAPERFEDFLEQRHDYGQEPYFWHRAIRGWYLQADYVTNERGAVRADILRFEHLRDDATRYFALKAPPRQRNRTARTTLEYRTVYNARTIQIVADWYQRDIELFGFDYDTPARQNTVFGDESTERPGAVPMRRRARS
ncbi:hypothetical protein DEA8626_00308 [Defluviimonas aquaemixtae]|uniref:Sulfotransferase family protein n=1 Tax=Albidovulum aquaemixtae TaxID=1542388 RepID=A0A2R8B2K2_9RHOB|nr:sulfotransferase family 2 domain-containing protein [Defluviimonas aquaemixtae]SPH16795.1 hypothetical protein DEA8626_00308 [Defluviimonas aquaemixtae]